MYYNMENVAEYYQICEFAESVLLTQHPGNGRVRVMDKRWKRPTGLSLFYVPKMYPRFGLEVSGRII